MIPRAHGPQPIQVLGIGSEHRTLTSSLQLQGQRLGIYTLRNRPRIESTLDRKLEGDPTFSH